MPRRTPTPPPSNHSEANSWPTWDHYISRAIHIAEENRASWDDADRRDALSDITNNCNASMTMMHHSSSKRLLPSSPSDIATLNSVNKYNNNVNNLFQQRNHVSASLNNKGWYMGH